MSKKTRKTEAQKVEERKYKRHQKTHGHGGKFLYM